jgi:uncharacterized damage-inducible protein DinB
MRNSIRIAGQIRRSLFHEGWHGPAVFEVLHGLDAAKAGAKTPIATHSIWQLVHHLRVWHEAALDSLSGKPLPLGDEAWALGWHPINEFSDTLWKIELDRFRNSGEKLIQRAATLDDKKLNEQVPGRAYDFAHLLLGISNHNVYHCGQIVLLHRYLHIANR